MKTLLILSALLSTTLLAGCVHNGTPPMNSPSGNSGTNTMMPDHAKSTPMDSDDHSAFSEESFIAGMIPHHQEAVDSAKIIVAKTKNQELKTVAQAIIEAQNKEIAQLKGWMNTWYPTSTVKPEYMAMMRDLTKLSDHDLDDAFMEDMIKHHEGAIHMAEDVLEISQRPEIVTLAKNIISSQAAEIATFKKMLADH